MQRLFAKVKRPKLSARYSRSHRQSARPTLSARSGRITDCLTDAAETTDYVLIFPDRTEVKDCLPDLPDIHCLLDLMEPSIVW